MVRLTLKYVLPLALLITSTLAQSDTTEDSVSKTATDEKETSTKTTATATKTDEAKTTATGTTTEKSGGSTTEKATTTEDSKQTFTWDPAAPVTTAPDIVSGAGAMGQSGYLVLTVVVGLLSMGMVMG